MLKRLENLLRVLCTYTRCRVIVYSVQTAHTHTQHTFDLKLKTMLTMYTAAKIRSDTKQQPEFSSIIESTSNEFWFRSSVHFHRKFNPPSPIPTNLQLFSRQFENNSFTASSTLFNIYQSFTMETLKIPRIWLRTIWLQFHSFVRFVQWIGKFRIQLVMNGFVSSFDHFEHKFLSFTCPEKCSNEIVGQDCPLFISSY